jgi:hypothetical protein
LFNLRIFEFMEKKFVEYKGRQVIEGWPEKIAEAQNEKTYLIGGTIYPRVPYGSEEEDWGANSHACGDCSAEKGELHVPSCDVEQCPACGGQVLSCDCEYDGDDEDDEEST